MTPDKMKISIRKHNRQHSAQKTLENNIIKEAFPDGDVLHIDTLFKAAGCAV